MHDEAWYDDPRQLLSERTLAFTWVLAGSRRHTSIRMPALRQNPLDTWGDWGPMHSIKLHATQQILVATRSEEAGIEQVSHLRPALVENEQGGMADRGHLRPARLHLESPMRADERRLTPLVLTLDDGWRGFRYRLGLADDGRVLKADVGQIPLWQSGGPALRLVADEQLRSMQWGGLA